MRSASNHPSLAIPKGPSRKTAKRKRHAHKVANITEVYREVSQREGEECRIGAVLKRFGFRRFPARLELAHYKGRGMGGNPDLSRDTVENTVLVAWDLHNGGRHSMHGGLIKITPMTKQGTNGPLAITFYEALPTEV